MSTWQTELLATAFLPDQFPDETVPEIAFLGRSNVGKSTLLNALTGRRLAHVSGTPGKTSSINFVDVRHARPFRLVDLPGYGFASRCQKERVRWQKLIESYLANRGSLLLSIQLVDFRHGLLENDRHLQEWTNRIGLPIQLVFTKVDKISRGRRKTMLAAYYKAGFFSLAEPLLVSGTDRTGIEELRSFIEGIVVDSRPQ